MLRALALFALCAPALANGFLIEGARPRPPVRLRTHRVTAVVNDRVAQVTVEQIFFNHANRALEGVYLFPLPRDAAVGEFAMTMGDTMVRGEVIDANEARRIYHSIVRRKRDPGLLEYVGRGLFRARVFPIPPNRELRIRLTYRQILDERDGTVEFRYPLATERLNDAPVETAVVDLRFESAVDLKTVYSPSHRINVDRSGRRRARVTYEAGRCRAVRDLLVYFGRSADRVGFTLLSSKPRDRDGTFLTVLAPSLTLDESEIVPKDVVYVVDVSGSMEGRKMVQAKLALARAVRLLRRKDRFNIVAFSSDWKQFRPELVAATKKTVHAAWKWIDGLAAGGGTALEAALSHSLRMGDPERLFLAVLVTDGRPTVGITDAGEIETQVLKANRARARVFTFGVGNDVDVALLDRIAKKTGGERDYVQPHEKIDAVTAKLFARVDQPVLTDVTLEMGRGLTQVYPRRLPDLFAGGQIILLGRYAGAGNTRFRLRGRRLGREVSYQYEAQLSGKEDALYLERLWAHRKVAFLLDEIRLNGHDRELAGEVVALATRHSIVTPYTSGLVVERGHGSISFASRGASHGRNFRGASGGSFRGPTGGVPPGLREPTGPEPPPPPPVAAAGSAGPTTPAGPMTPSDVSEDLKRRKKEAVAKAESHIARAAGKTFLRDKEGRWVDRDWDGKGEPKRILAYSEEYFDLLENSDDVARCLAVGERIIFVHEGTVYEVYTGGA